MKNKIVNSYKRENDNDFITTNNKVMAKMDGNTTFVNPPEALAVIKKVLPEFIVAVVNAGDRDRVKISIKNDKRVVIEAALAELANYVTSVCKGDRTLLMTSGFELNSSKSESSLGVIASLDVSIDHPNEAATRIKRVKGARAYLHQYTTDPLTGDSVWTSKTITETRYTFEGLQSQKKYLFKVIAIGFKGQEAHSPMVSKVIQ